MTWLEVIDSAVKIGLGALIGGSVSLISLHLSHRNDRSKDLRSHHIKTIESISENVDQFFNAHLGLMSKIAWYVDRGNGGAIPVTEQLAESLRTPDQNLLDASNLERAALSRLTLLGATNCVVLLRQAGSLIMDFRNDCAANLMLPAATDIQMHLSQVELVKNELHEQLHLIYRAC